MPSTAGDLTLWLKEMALGQYAETFAANGIDWDVLADLSEQDLKELGFSLGDRKRLLKAIAALDAGDLHADADAAIEVREPPSAAKSAASDDGERRQITVMFVDLVGSTALSKRLDPEEMRDVLNAFQMTSAEIVERYDGYVAQCLGDGILIYFGYPRAHGDDAVRTLQAGLDIIEAMPSINARLEAEHRVRLQARIGVHTGLVVAGEIGPGSLRDSLAIGETPNVAARLQSYALPDTLLISSATHRLVEGFFQFDELGPHEPKGLSEPIHLYRVVAASEAVSRLDDRRRAFTPLVGRTAELEVVRQRWMQACDGEMRCVLVVGEPGIGKSRLFQALRDSITDERQDQITFVCSSYHQNSAFWPVLEWFRRVLHVDLKKPSGNEIEDLETELGRLALDVGELAPIFAAFLGLRTADRHVTMDPSSASFKARMLAGLVSLVAAIASCRPTLLFLEDAHWADPSTLEFMQLILERLVSARLLLFVTARPEFKPGWNYPHVLQINLDRLSRRDREGMVERLTAGKPLPRVIMDEIIAKTDGIPLFVEELTKSVLEGNLLRDAGDRYELIGPERGISIPDSLQGLLLARLDRLDPKAKELAQISAVIGREFGRDLLAAVSGWPSEAMERALTALIAAEIVQRISRSLLSGGSYVFRHALIQEAAYQSTLLARRKHFHEAIVQALEDRFPEYVETQPELLAEHLTSARLPARAVGYWLRAGERAAVHSAFLEAAAHLRRGLELAESLPRSGAERSRIALPLLLLRGFAEARIGARQATNTFRAAAEIARVEGLPIEFAEAATGFEEAELFLATPSEASVTLLEEALTTAGEETIAQCRVLSRLGRALQSVGQFDRSIDVTRRAMPLARRLGDQRSLVTCLMCELISEGVHPVSAQQFSSRREKLKEIDSVAQHLGDLDNEIDYVTTTCLPFQLEIGDISSFEANLSRCAQIRKNVYQARVMDWIIASARTMLAILHGEFKLAEDGANQTFERGEQLQADFPLGVYGMQMFTIRREQGRLGEVATLFKRFVDDNPGDSTWRPGLMLIASDLGFEAQARKILDETMASGLRLPVDGRRSVTLSYFAEVCARLGDVQRAEEVFDLLLPYRDMAIVVPIVTLCCGSVARYLGMLAATMRRWDVAEEHFEAALAMDEGMAAAPWLAHTQHEYARTLIARGRGVDFPRARELRRAATKTAEELGMAALLQKLRAGHNGH